MTLEPRWRRVEGERRVGRSKTRPGPLRMLVGVVMFLFKVRRSLRGSGRWWVRRPNRIAGRRGQTRRGLQRDGRARRRFFHRAAPSTRASSMGAYGGGPEASPASQMEPEVIPPGCGSQGTIKPGGPAGPTNLSSQHLQPASLRGSPGAAAPAPGQHPTRQWMEWGGAFDDIPPAPTTQDAPVGRYLSFWRVGDGVLTAPTPASSSPA